MDALERVFRLQELNKSEPEIYSKIIKFRDILLEKTQNITKITEEKTAPLNKILKNTTKQPKTIPSTGIILGIIATGVGTLGYYLKEKKIPQQSTQKNLNYQLIGTNVIHLLFHVQNIHWIKNAEMNQILKNGMKTFSINIVQINFKIKYIKTLLYIIIYGTFL